MTDGPWTTRRLLAWMTDAFARRGLESHRLMAELLLAHVIGCDRLRLYMDADRPATDLERAGLRDLVARALAHEPVQYLVGEAWFFGLPFRVDRRVLIPRPATETIVEQVLLHARAGAGRSGEGPVIADVCTGSGCIAVALATQLPGARLFATDLSRPALDLAAENARRHRVADRVELLCGDLLAPIRDHPAAGSAGSLNALVANPPYIPDHEWDAVPPNVKDHEPALALRGGPDGLRLVRELVAGAPFFLSPGGLLLVEIAESTADEALALARAEPRLDRAGLLEDFEGRPRVIIATRRAG